MLLCFRLACGAAAVIKYAAVQQFHNAAVRAFTARIHVPVFNIFHGGYHIKVCIKCQWSIFTILGRIAY
jgi:hypothetical protein